MYELTVTVCCPLYAPKPRDKEEKANCAYCKYSDSCIWYENWKMLKELSDRANKYRGSTR